MNTEETRETKKRKPTGRVKTNIPELDEMLGGGLAPGLHCVTGGPSSYKSATLLQIAYLAAMDGFATEYITDEIGVIECMARLTTRKMFVNMCSQITQPCGDFSWSDMERMFTESGESGQIDEVPGGIVDEESFMSLLNQSWGELREVVRADLIGGAPGMLHIKEMGDYLERSWTEHNAFEWLFGGHDRYFTSLMQRSKKDREFFDDVMHGTANLIVIDPVNSLRTCEWQSVGGEEVRDNTPESKRALMEQHVELLDNWGRSTGTAIIGVFHKHRTANKYPQPPSMGDFKETSCIEYRAVSAWEFVRADDMRWSNHPKPPKVPEGTEAVALYLLKSRAGRRTEHNGPIWLCADGAHNLIYPLE